MTTTGRARRALRIASAAVVAAVALATGCASLLGLDDVTYSARVEDGARPPVDSGTDVAPTEASCDACASSFVIASDLDSPEGIAVTAAHVYFGLAGNKVARCPLSGCSDAGPEIVTNVVTPKSLATDGTDVFVLGGPGAQNADYVIRCPSASACPDGGIAVATGIFYASQVTVADGVVYFTHDLVNSGGVGACPVSGNACGIDSGTRGGYVAVRAVAAGQGSLFFSTSSNQDPVIRKCSTTALGSCDWDASVFSVPSSTLLVESLVLTADGQLLWANPKIQAVEACPATTCPQSGPTRLVQNAAGIHAIAADEKTIYFSTYDEPSRTRGAGRIGSCALSTGCARPVPLVEQLDEPVNIAVDANRIYWVDRGFGVGGAGRVMSARK